MRANSNQTDAKLLIKGGFVSESVMCFSNLQISKQSYSNIPKTIQNIQYVTVNNKFKFQAQDSNLKYFYFGDLEI